MINKFATIKLFMYQCKKYVTTFYLLKTIKKNKMDGLWV